MIVSALLLNVSHKNTGEIQWKKSCEKRAIIQKGSSENGFRPYLKWLMFRKLDSENDRSGRMKERNKFEGKSLVMVDTYIFLHGAFALYFFSVRFESL